MKENQKTNSMPASEHLKVIRYTPLAEIQIKYVK